MPRLLISMALVVVCIFVVIIGFKWVLDSGWFLAVLAVLFGLVSIHTGLEYHKSLSFVRGEIENVPISDLTKAISWLSELSKGGATGMIGGGRGAWLNVDKVADRIGGEFKSKWLSIVQNHRMPIRERTMVLTIPVAFLPFVGVFLILFFVKTGIFQLVALLSLLPLMIVMFRFLSKKVMAVSDLYESEEARTTAGVLARQLILLVSTRTTRPIKVVLAGGEYEHVHAIDSAWGSTIAEIEPSGVTVSGKERFFPHGLKEEHVSFLGSKRNWHIATILAHASVGFITVPLVFLFLQKIISGMADNLDRGAFGLTIIAAVFGQFFVYVSMPQMKLFFTGGKVTALDLYAIVKRTPSHLMMNTNYSDFIEKTAFLTTMNEKRTMKLSELADSIKFWLRDEENQPMEQRYFNIEGDKVSLTAKGEELAELVEKKMRGETHVFLNRF